MNWVLIWLLSFGKKTHFWVLIWICLYYAFCFVYLIILCFCFWVLVLVLCLCLWGFRATSQLIYWLYSSWSSVFLIPRVPEFDLTMFNLSVYAFFSSVTVMIIRLCYPWDKPDFDLTMFNYWSMHSFFGHCYDHASLLSLEYPIPILLCLMYWYMHSFFRSLSWTSVGLVFYSSSSVPLDCFMLIFV